MSANELKNRVSQVCTALEEEGFLDIIARAGATEILERIVAALRAEGSTETLAEELDLLEHRLAEIGLDGLTDSYRSYRPPPGAEGHPVVKVWVCPIGRCSRMATRMTQRCAATNRPFNLVRLPT